MEHIRIDVKVIDHKDPAFWYQAKLHGCKLKKTLGSQAERFASGTIQPPDGTLLTYGIAGGDADFEFEDYWILQVDAQQPERIFGGGDHSYPHGYLRGPFEVLAHGRGKEHAGRLKRWWMEWAPAHGGQTAKMARWLEQQMRKGKEQPVGAAPRASDKDIYFNPLEAWSFQ